MTALYGVRVMALEPERRRVRLRVFVTYYDADEYDQALVDADTSFFLRVLWDKADTRFDVGGPLGEHISLDEILDEDWVDGNTWHFIERFEAVSSANVPFTEADIAGLPERHSMGGWFTHEESLVRTDYDVWVTDPRWLAHLWLGRSWDTAAYPTGADRLRPEDAPYVPDPRPPAARFDTIKGRVAGGPAFSSDGRWLAVASTAGELVVYDAATWTERLRASSGVSLPSVDWSPGRPLITLQPQAPDSPAWAYDLDTDAVVAASPRRRPTHSANGRHRLSRRADGALVIDGDNGTQRPMPVEGAPTAAAFAPDGSRLYVAVNGDILAIDPATGDITENVRSGYRSSSWPDEPERVRSLAVDQTGHYLAVGGEHRLAVLRLADGDILVRVPPGDAFVAWSPDGRWLTATSGLRSGGETTCLRIGRPAGLPEPASTPETNNKEPLPAESAADKGEVSLNPALVRSLTEASEPLDAAELDAIRTAHQQWLDSGGGARGPQMDDWYSRWQVLNAAGLPLAVFQGPNGSEGAQASLRNRSLRGLELSGLDLPWADLTAILAERMDLSSANLVGCAVTDAFLAGVSLTGADLTLADFSRSDLRGADLSRADLSFTDFEGADLTGADFTGARITEINLRRARIADIRGFGT